jgi:hypothetical protein
MDLSMAARLLFFAQGLFAGALYSMNFADSRDHDRCLDASRFAGKSKCGFGNKLNSAKQGQDRFHDSKKNKALPLLSVMDAY